MLLTFILLVLFPAFLHEHLFGDQRRIKMNHEVLLDKLDYLAREARLPYDLPHGCYVPPPIKESEPAELEEETRRKDLLRKAEELLDNSRGYYLSGGRDAAEFFIKLAKAYEEMAAAIRPGW